jgi:transcriptional regulator with XRE-family HTH domain
MAAMTRGRRALIALLQRTKLEYVAARVGVSQATISRWASGERRPNAEHAKKLENAYPEFFRELA